MTRRQHYLELNRAETVLTRGRDLVAIRVFVLAGPGIDAITHTTVILGQLYVAADHGLTGNTEGGDCFERFRLGIGTNHGRNANRSASTNHRLHQGGGMRDGGINRLFGCGEVASETGNHFVLVHGKPSRETS